jgi:hypothetical protein
MVHTALATSLLACRRRVHGGRGRAPVPGGFIRPLPVQHPRLAVAQGTRDAAGWTRGVGAKAARDAPIRRSKWLPSIDRRVLWGDGWRRRFELTAILRGEEFPLRPPTPEVMWKLSALACSGAAICGKE